MKYVFCLYAVIFSLIVPATAISQTNLENVTGVWQLISSKGSINNIPIDHDSSKVYMLKILSPPMFVNTVYDKKTNHFQSTVQGTFTVTDSTYSEFVLNSSVGDFPSHGFIYNYFIANNILTIHGESNGIKLAERWKKIEKQE